MGSAQIYVVSHLSNTATKFYGELTQQMIKMGDSPGSDNGTGTDAASASMSSTRRTREPRPYLTVISRRFLPDARVAQDPRVLREALGRRGRGRGAGQGRGVECSSLPY